MRAESCEGCQYLQSKTGYHCLRHNKHIARIRGCSISPSGKKFFRAKSGAEAIRMKLPTTKQGDPK